ncbi:hypothetical protein L208DRAFT_1384110 [Tricholoma matsutake]|nr:hypothetical protein L208DRAFT_1384110 [Tricholoma matsutake 945]
MDPNQHLQLQQQLQSPQPAPPPTSANKRRKKTEPGTDEVQSPTEPRRLRRSHEACARCRSKKIKCDSKHPRCTACATAGVICHQEDRHRQTLTPRGHTERIENQVIQCEALLKRHIPGFDLDKLEEHLIREGLDVPIANPNVPSSASNFQFQQSPTSSAYRGAQPQQQQPPGVFYPPPPPNMMGPPPPGYMMPPYGAHFHPMQMQPPGYNPHIHPAFQQPPPGYPSAQHMSQVQPQSQPQPAAKTQPQPQPQSQLAQRPDSSKGLDPNGNDMSNTESLAKNFGVSPIVAGDLSPGAADKEDLAVGSSGLSSGRDRDISTPRDASKWVTISVRRNSTTSPHPVSLSNTASSRSFEVWLPKDREMVQHVVECYFTRLNVHRPVFLRKDFEKILNDLYDGHTVSHDPGYICSVYLILALGTLSELNHRAVKTETERKWDILGPLGPPMAKKLMPEDWPEHDEFMDRALAVKPDLRVTISSLQALILLHWYLYTERQGRTLWRLVGSLVRISIELGLHHDPTTQVNPTTLQPIFSGEECQLRMRLWAIVLVHDRGTSILLGRPLAISPSDSNTPAPTRLPSDFSEHFELSNPVAEIQADIINSLYKPGHQDGDTIMRNATRIIRAMLEFRKSIPERYRYYFEGTSEWPLEKKSKLVQDITENEGLTLLKIGIARILLLRALFSSKELSYAQRHKALVDAIITSHNTIVVHNQLIRFPDIAFFTSPIPLHIAAMVILYGHMSKCEILPRQTALEDLWLALDMLPRFRWRWERKDFNGGHPLIAKLAERVMEVDLQQVGPVNHPSLLCEPEWDEDIVMSPVGKSQQSTPTLTPSPYAIAAVAPGAVVYGPHPRPKNGGVLGQALQGQQAVKGKGGNAKKSVGAGSTSGGSTPSDNQQLVDVPAQLFYPFYPETQVGSMPPPASVPGNVSGNVGPGVGVGPGAGGVVASPNGSVNGSSSGGGGGGSVSAHQRDYSGLLAAAAATYGYQSSDSFVSEERDPKLSVQQQQGMQMWVNAQAQRGPMQTYAVPQP